MTVDKTGRKLKIGQIVDILCMGTMQGKVMDIKDSPIAIPGSGPIPPHIVVQLLCTPVIQQNSLVDAVYIIRDPDPKDPLVIESEKSHKPKIELVQ